MLHLGQVLYTGKDFVILMSEGEPARSAGRAPRQALAPARRGQHAALAPLRRRPRVLDRRHARRPCAAEDLPVLEPWARFWRTWVSVAFLQRYLRHRRRRAASCPQSRDELQAALDAYLLEKALHEIGYELDAAPGLGAASPSSESSN